MKEIWHSRNVSLPLQNKIRCQLFLQALKPTDIVVAWAEVWAAPWACIPPLPGNSIWAVKRFREESWWICNDLLLFPSEKCLFFFLNGSGVQQCPSSPFLSFLFLLSHSAAWERRALWVVTAQCCVCKDPGAEWNKCAVRLPPLFCLSQFLRFPEAAVRVQD